MCLFKLCFVMAEVRNFFLENLIDPMTNDVLVRQIDS
jgi:hypothetical protein